MAAAQWTADQLARRAQAEAGQSVLANRKQDRALIAWATEAGRAVYIGRAIPRIGLPGSIWGNPYCINRRASEPDAERQRVCDLYRQHVRESQELQNRLDELRAGKVLICWCYPNQCHGEILLAEISQT